MNEISLVTSIHPKYGSPPKPINSHGCTGAELDDFCNLLPFAFSKSTHPEVEG